MNMEEVFMSMENFDDSPIFSGDGSDNHIDIIDNETALSAEEAERLAQSFLEGKPDANTDDKQPDVDDNKDIETTEDANPEDVGGEEDVDDEGGENDDSDSSSNLYSSLANVIHEQGLLPSVDITNEKIESIDDFTRILTKEQEAQVLKRFNDYVANLDVDKIAKPITEIRNLETVDETYLMDNIDYAKELIRKEYTNQGLSEERVNRIVNRLVDLGEEDLIDEALKAKDSILEQNKRIVEEEQQRQFKEREKAEKEAQKVQETIRKRIFEQDIIEGFNPTKAFREKMYNTMTTIVGEDPYGNPENAFMRARREDVVGFETRMYALFELTDGFTNFDKLVSTSKSKAIKDLEKAARATIINNNSTPAYVADKESYFGSGDFTLNI